MCDFIWKTVRIAYISQLQHLSPGQRPSSIQCIPSGAVTWPILREPISRRFRLWQVQHGNARRSPGGDQSMWTLVTEWKIRLCLHILAGYSSSGNEEAINEIREWFVSKSDFKGCSRINDEYAAEIDTCGQNRLRYDCYYSYFSKMRRAVILGFIHYNIPIF